MYTCQICLLPFLTVNELGNHLVFEHQLLHNDNYVCFHCKDNFTHLAGFKRHLYKRHPVNMGDNVNNNQTNDHLIDREDDFQNAHVIDENVCDNDGDHNDRDDNESLFEDNERFSLQFFVNSLYSNVQYYISQLYQIPNVNRKLVDTIVVATSELIESSVSLLKDNVLSFVSNFEDVPNNFGEELGKIQDMFSTIMNPFEYMATEHKRFNELQASGTYIPPIKYEMGFEEKYVTQPDNSVVLIQSPVYGQYVPLRKVLKVFLELPGVFSAISDYVESLYNNLGKISNVVQGTLWRDIRLSYESEGKFVLPLNVEFDDYEPDNVLGAHHGSHSLGGLYAVIPCLPPEHQSCLDNMFLFSLFESKHRKKFGNSAAFTPAIEELTYLSESGISVTVDGTETQVYFCLCLIVADNLGYNSILNFVESFTGNFYCRICRLHRNQMHYQCNPVPENMLRTFESYTEDLAVEDVSETGLNGECVWDRVPSFHCVVNSNCDTMHDCCLGLLKYSLCNILNYLVNVRGYLDIDLLKERIDGYTYGPSDIGNKPPTLNLTASVLETCSLNLSAAEYLFLGLHLSLMIGDLIPEGNPVWHYYLVLREILEIALAPFFYPGLEVYLSTLVQEHHELYIRYFGTLKPRMHFLLHYYALFRQNGPLVLVNSLMCERFHRKGKLYAHSSNSRVNLPLSSATKFQLMLSERLMRKDNFRVRIKTSKVNRVPLVTLPNYMTLAEELQLNLDDFVLTVKKAEVSGTLYSLNMIIVLGMQDFMATFGKIFRIITANNDIYFVINILNTDMYLEHVAAYQISHTDNWIILRQSRLFYHIPLWERFYKGRSVVALKHTL